MPDIRFSQLTVANFFPFTQPVVVDFSGEPGLIFVTGDNQVDPELDANGVGKSKLFDALIFALFGYTSEGLRGPDLINWNVGREAVVELQFSVDGVAYTIERTIKPNSLTLMQHGEQARPIEQHVIDDLIGVSMAVYMAMSHHGQRGHSSFLELGATEKLDLLVELLALNVYERAAKVARDFAVEAKEVIQLTTVSIASLRGRLSVYYNQADDLEDKEVKYLRKRLRFLIGVDREISGWKAQRIVEEKKLNRAREAVNSVDFDQLKVIKEQADDAGHKAAGARAEITLLRTRRAVLYTSVKQATECPTCGRAFTDAKTARNHAKSELASIDAQLADMETACKSLENSYKSQNARYLSVGKELEEASDKAHKMLQEAIAASASCTTTVLELEKNKKAMLIEENPVEDDIIAVTASIEELQTKLARNNMKLGNAIQQEATYSFWVKAFKELRLSIVESTLFMLTTHVNNSLLQLGLSNWQIAIEAEGLNKSGTVRRGMRVAIVVNGTERPIPLLSGGEYQRVKLAVALGMSDVIQSIKATTFNFEFFDEPTSWLSTGGVEQLLTVLTERARFSERRIYLADHRSHAWPFTDTLVLTKTAEGTTINA